MVFEAITISDFAIRKGDRFMLSAPGRASEEAELISVDTLGFNVKPDGSRAGRESFSLVFRVNKTWSLPQQTFGISHPILGTGEMFLVPIGPDAEGMRLEAIFNFV
ncbi:MAG TPA: hypothetical protein P5186_14265 [Candidatus Paceibacterota bacterium]|nr:hypothetical protein [Verrucomicrobiota bacterium]HRY49210.1 hypothetical protein [Candidatus Paceibacterota bacterium]HSA03104.1 hypothetical protein [Candidatus Paceibacterota bacterium]